ncbi:MAG: hypothetical protein GY838_03945 [bacterium]|nr:hypothetical protein [bacterium]
MTTFGEVFNTLGAPALDGHLADDVTYHPGSGASRAVSAAVTESANFADEQTGKVSETSIGIHVSRDATAGIDNPQIGDGITRATDPPGVGYSFTGEKSDVSTTHWTLHFTRNITARHETQR